MKEAIERYLRQILGEECTLAVLKPAATLPMYYTSQYIFYRVALRGTSCVMCVDVGNGHITPMYLERQMSLLHEHFHVHVVYCARQLEYHQALRIVSRNIPVVIPDKLLFLPFLALSLSYTRKGRQLASEKFSRNAQLVVIGYLLHRLSSPVTLNAVVEKTGCSYALASNALEELRQFNLGEKHAAGKGHGVEFVFFSQGRELWEQAQDYFINPCKHTIGIAERAKDIAGVKAGANALADKTMLGESKPDVFAMALTDFRKAPLQKIAPDSAETLLQLWQYKPDIYGDKTIDTLSLYLSLKDDKDERVQMALEQLLGEFEW